MAVGPAPKKRCIVTFKRIFQKLDHFDFDQKGIRPMNNAQRLIPLLVFILISMCFTISCAEVEGNAYDVIFDTFQEKSNWEDICPVCRTLFQHAFEEVVAGSEEWQKLVYIKASCLGEEARDDEAIRLIKNALVISPGNYRFQYVLGCAYLRLNDQDSAEKYLTLSNSGKKNKDAFYKLAAIHYLKAMSSPSSAPKMDLLYQAESEIKEALGQSIDESLELSEIQDTAITRDILHCLDLLSNIYNGQGKTEEAVALRRKLLFAAENTIDWDTPREKSIMIAQQKQAIGQLLYIAGRQDEGLELMKAAVDIAPTEELKEHFNFILKSTTAQISQEEIENTGITSGSFILLE